MKQSITILLQSGVKIGKAENHSVRMPEERAEKPLIAWKRDMPEDTLHPIDLATELTIAWLGNQNNRVSADDVPAFLRTMHTTIVALAAEPVPLLESGKEVVSTEMFTPAVTVRKSLASKDFIVSMIDGKPYRTLRRHISRHGLTDVEYRERYNLRPDYPMVAESYSIARREMAQKIGLGRKAKSVSVATEATDNRPAKPALAITADEVPAPTPAKRMRRKKTDETA